MSMMETQNKKLTTLRENVLHQIEDVMEGPLVFLAFIWLVLTIMDLTGGLSSFLQHVMTAIWVVFWFDFILKLVLAARKKVFLRDNILTILALVLPAFRIFRVFRVFRGLRAASAFKGSYLIRILGSFNRGMNALSKTLGRRGFGYILLLTSIVVLLGAAGIYSLEFKQGGPIDGFGTALWWSAMMITTMGSDYFPESPEARFLSFVLAVYGFAIFGYVTATVASFFIDRDAASAESSVASEEKLQQIENQIRELRELISRQK